jgi:sodium/potassium-transporting ATPase subunit alpha
VQDLGSDLKNGMSKSAAEERLLKEGVNELSEKDVVPWYCVFLHELTGFFSLLLWFGSALCFIGQILSEDKNDKSYLYLGIVLALVTFLTGVFSYQ